MALTDAKLRAAKPSNKPYKLYDMNGLFIFISPNGSKLWRLKYQFRGKEKLCSLGAYPDIGLKEAREERDKLKKLLSQGTDPSHHKRMVKYQQLAASENTLEAVARRWFDIKNIDADHKGERSVTAARTCTPFRNWDLTLSMKSTTR